MAGDKSISHRAVILGAIAEGVTLVSNMLEGEDVIATIRAFRAMGIEIERNSGSQPDNNYQITGKGLSGLSKPEGALNLGNSGTALRLLTGLLSGQPWSCTLIGDESLTRRPMGRVIDPLSTMGAVIHSDAGKPPLYIDAGERLAGISYSPPMASAQVKSAVLLAGLYADGITSVSERGITRDHTERMLQGFGYDVSINSGTVSVKGGGRLVGQRIEVPADLSSAAFFILGGLIARDGCVRLKKVGVNPSRNGVLEIFRRMGARIELTDRSVVSGEPVADILVQSSALQGTIVAGKDVALSIDEIPVVAIAAAYARGTTKICEAQELRVKESDRIGAMVTGLRRLGVSAEETPDGMVIEGGKLQGGEVDSFGDHRIAMAFSMAGVAAESAVKILNCENVSTSFPNFEELCTQVGVNIKRE